MAGPYVLELQRVSKTMGRKEALRDVSFTLGPGEFVALLGPNGAGKTTLLSLVTGLRRASVGEVKLFGMEPWRPEARARRGVTAQDLEFPPHLTVRETLALVRGFYARGVSVDDSIDRFGLTKIADQKTGGLSGGERRRIGLAMALLGDPELIVLDEPTTGLDLEARDELWRLLAEEKRRGKTILLTSHDLNEVEQLAGRLCVLNEGRIVFAGAMGEILAQVRRQRVEFHAEHPLDSLGGHPIEHFGGKKSVVTVDSDAFVRALVRSEIEFRHLRIEAAGLEEALKNLPEDRP